MVYKYSLKGLKENKMTTLYKLYTVAEEWDNGDKLHDTVIGVFSSLDNAIKYKPKQDPNICAIFIDVIQLDKVEDKENTRCFYVSIKSDEVFELKKHYTLLNRDYESQKLDS